MAIYVGTTGIDVYYGAAADDTISGLAGIDFLYGGGGDDVIDGGDGNDSLYGDLGADKIQGGAGDDSINGGNDDDVDVMTGGAGADNFRLIVANRPANLTAIDHIVDFSSAQGDIIDLQRALTANFAWVGAVSNPSFSFSVGQSFGGGPGTGYQGIFTWTTASTTYVIVDTNGDGLLDAKDFALALDGAPDVAVTDLYQLRGDIFHVGSEGADIWRGTNVKDYYYGRGGNDDAQGGAGGDELHGGAGNDRLSGGDGDDFLYGDQGGDTLYGGAGADVLSAASVTYGEGDSSDSVNYLYGEAGNDNLMGIVGSYGGGEAVLDGGDGDDWLNGGARDTLRGGAGADTLSGGRSQDGGDGADKLSASPIYGGGSYLTGVRTLTGGAGADVFLVSVSSPQTYGGGWSSAGYATITDFSVNEGDRIAFSFGWGSRNPTVLRGAVASGFSLTDGKVFSASDYGPGFSQLWTWADGANLYLILDSDADGKLSSADYVLKLNGLSDLGLSAFTTDSLDTQNGLTTKLGGTSSGDVLIGTTAPETFYGLGGDDQLHGGDADDHLYGNEGDDQIWGDEGQDYLYGGRGDDVINGGDGADQIEGGAGADTIHGGAGGDSLKAGGYDLRDQDDANTVNVIYGDDGDDQISGGYSLHDQLHGGDGRDSLFGNGELWGDAGDDSLSTNKAAIMHGGDGDDSLGWVTDQGAAVMYGDAGKDSYYGGSGDDVINLDLGDRSANAGYGADRFNISDVRAGETVTLTIVYGDYSRDTFAIQASLSAVLTIDGGYDDDLLDLSLASGVTRVDLNVADAQDTGMGRLILRSVEGVKGGDHGAVLVGDANANQFTGGAAADTLSGGKGADVLAGGGGADDIDGGEGTDIAAYAGASTDYSWTRASNDVWTVKDLRTDAPDGTDTVRNVESLRFSDRSVALVYALPTTVGTAFTSILRAPIGGDAQFAFGVDLAGKINAGLSFGLAIGEVIKAADATTSVAAMAYEFFTGKVPGQAGVDYLVSPTGPNANNLNSAYYQSFNLENRYINFAVNLGKMGEGKDAFTAKYGSLSLFDATREAYKTIFGGTPVDDKVHALIDGRIDYFASYGGDGAGGIGTKAAMVGWLLAEAQKADLGVMARSANAWLMDLADGSAPFAVDILDPAAGYYKADFVFGGS